MTSAKLSRAELERLSPDQLIAYIETGGDWTDGAGSHPPKGPRPADLPSVSDLPMQVTSIRLPVAMIEELDKRAGRDRDGRSGIVRDAVADWLANHPVGEAA